MYIVYIVVDIQSKYAGYYTGYNKGYYSIIQGITSYNTPPLNRIARPRAYMPKISFKL